MPDRSLPLIPSHIQYHASVQSLNRFYKQHGYEGRMHPDDIGIFLLTECDTPACALRLIQHPNTLRLRHLFTAPSQRQQGLASHLLSQTLSWLQHEQAATNVSLMCQTGLVPFYQRHGFQRLSEHASLVPTFSLNRTEAKLLRSSQYHLMHCPLMT